MSSDTPGLPRRTIPIILGIVLAAVSASRAQPALIQPKSTLIEETKPPESAPKKPQALPKLTLRECLAIAMEKQPKLAVLKASIGSANASYLAIENTHLLRLSPDHKYRLGQACIGKQAAETELEQAIHDVTHAVVWTYYLVVYARDQQKATEEARRLAEFYLDPVQKTVEHKGGDREINVVVLRHLRARVAEAARLELKAESGFERAKAALREAMGVDSNYFFDVADQTLPDFANFDIKRDDVIGHAQTRRGEVILASLFSEASRLEAYAQWSILFRLRVETFASGGDIHSRHIPPGSKEGDYRPDAIGPEMPVQMIGGHGIRSQKAWELAARSDAVLQKTKNLVTLEADTAWCDYHYAGLSMAKAKIQLQESKENLKDLKEAAGMVIDNRSKLEQVLMAQEETTKAQAALNEAIYQRISALANIERITAGGVRINYPGR